ncbi:MAG: hypothetical protein H6Q05_307 [Acidobacteria bacterium]|nr:hypothetical protein [Acidobacteriota bacterium]
MGLRQLFGPSKEEIWRQLSSEIGAHFIEGGFWRGDKVQASVGEWSVTLDIYTVHAGNAHVKYTRLRAPYVNSDGFRFLVYRAGLFSGLGKHMGMQDVEVGVPDFDRGFVIKGNNETLLRWLFADDRLRTLLQEQPEVRFEVVDDEGWFGARFPDGVDELRFQTRGVIKDVQRLKQLFELFSATLERLCAMGSAYRNKPAVEL